MLCPPSDSCVEAPLRFLCGSPKAQDLRMWDKAKLVSGQPSVKEMRHVSHGSNLPFQQKLGKTCGGPSCLMIWTLMKLHGRILCQQKHSKSGLKGTETRWNEGWMTLKVVQGFTPPWPKRAAWEGRATLPFWWVLRIQLSAKDYSQALNSNGICPATFKPGWELRPPFSLWSSFWKGDTCSMPVLPPRFESR